MVGSDRAFSFTWSNGTFGNSFFNCESIVFVGPRPLLLLKSFLKLLVLVLVVLVPEFTVHDFTVPDELGYGSAVPEFLGYGSDVDLSRFSPYPIFSGMVFSGSFGSSATG